ncbi:PTS sugar transporter subunit IIA [Anaerostipes faecalis]|uniref:PTS sugar transporter subunit IIA n=1 Tax=Anaerostipes faecalis TaxID=2738446 RepID=UPI001C1DF775|nr:PTS sugar transporter subunit IIA [Anaerostipes faecalis]MDY2726099.1 PTS sugar transporter subunit IIA [Anaerostipes faecalis]
MAVSNIFDKDSIVLGAKFSDKKEVIEETGKLLLNRGHIQPEYIDAMLEREEKFSVYIGNGVAIPHGVGGSEKYIKSSGIALIQVPDGVSFGKNKTAYVIIGIAGVDGEHLDILAKLAITCSDIEKVEKIRMAVSKEEILKLIDM